MNVKFKLEKKKLLARLIELIILIIYVAMLIAVNNIDRKELMNNEGRTFEKAVVTEIVKDNIQKSGIRVGQQNIRIKLLTGKNKGKIIDAVSSSSYLYGADCSVGLKVIATVSEYKDELVASIYNYDRGSVLYIIIIFFVIVLWIIGGKKGIKSAIGLAFTFVCIIFLFLPLVYRGVSPVLAATIVSLLTTVVVMYLISGISGKSISAMFGTVIGVIISAVFAHVFGMLTHISGNNVSDIENLKYIEQVTSIDVGELMFAGILISTLGAVMDVAISVSSAVNEIHECSPNMNRKQLFLSGMNVGRDMMGTMSNTLILAFAGSSINTLIYIYCYKYSYYQILNMYSIGLEIIQGLSSTLGVVITVPVVAFISAFWVEVDYLKLVRDKFGPFRK